MGDYSNLVKGTLIPSKYPYTKVKKMFEKFKDDKREYLEIYEFKKHFREKIEEGVYLIELGVVDDEYINKHYASDELAKFISMIIHPDYSHELIFADYEEMFGYFITENRVLDIYFLPVVYIDGKRKTIQEIRKLEGYKSSEGIIVT